MSESPEPTRIDRREALKRVAVVGGTLVWTVPTIQTIGMNAAMAAGTPADCTPANTFRVKFDTIQDANDMIIGFQGCQSAVGAEDCLGSAQDGCSLVGAPTTNGTQVFFDIPRGCTLVAATSKCAVHCHDATANGNSLTFNPCPAPGGGVRAISHIEVLFCCQ